MSIFLFTISRFSRKQYLFILFFISNFACKNQNTVVPKNKVHSKLNFKRIKRIGAGNKNKNPVNIIKKKFIKNFKPCFIKKNKKKIDISKTKKYQIDSGKNHLSITPKYKQIKKLKSDKNINKSKLPKCNFSQKTHTDKKLVPTKKSNLKTKKIKATNKKKVLTKDKKTTINLSKKELILLKKFKKYIKGDINEIITKINDSNKKLKKSEIQNLKTILGLNFVPAFGLSLVVLGIIFAMINPISIIVEIIISIVGLSLVIGHNLVSSFLLYRKIKKLKKELNKNNVTINHVDEDIENSVLTESD